MVVSVGNNYFLNKIWIQFCIDLYQIGKHHHLSDEDKARLAAARISEEQKKSRVWYRINANRKMFGGKSLEPRLNPQLSLVRQLLSCCG